MTRAALYARVSTGDQNEGMQVAEMREFVSKRGWEYELFTDPGISGARERRPGLDAMMTHIRRRKFDAVVVYRFDRFARSVKHLVSALDEFRELGIQFVSLHEQLDTTTSQGRFMFQIFAAIAEFEREIIRARVKSGLAAARAKGIVLGRRRRVLDSLYISERRAQGATWEALAAELKVSVDTLQRRAKMAAKSRFHSVVKSG